MSWEDKILSPPFFYVRLHQKSEMSFFILLLLTFDPEVVVALPPTLHVAVQNEASSRCCDLNCGLVRTSVNS